MAALGFSAFARRAVGAGAALAALSLGCAPAFAGKAMWHAEMTGAGEAPNPGDPAAKGMAMISVDDATGELCYELSVSGIEKVTMAHVHKGAKGASGPPVATLDAPVDGASKSCAKVDPAVAKAIIAAPADYYVNVHSAKFPAGAIRAQLGG